MVCNVETLGFDTVEQKTLAATFALSVRREVAYAHWNASLSVPPDLFLVNGDNPQAVQQMLKRKLDPRYPPIVVAASFPTNFPCAYVERPLRFLRLFKALDQAMEAKLDADKGEYNTQHQGVWANTLTTSSVVPLEPATPVIPTVAIKPPSKIIVSLASSAQSSAPMRHAGEASQPQSGSAWVLVVDDNMAVRRFMAQKLQQFSINVDYAASGEEAISLTGSKRYTCVFLDVVMPGIDGYQACKLIKAGHSNDYTRVVMLTSRDGVFDKIRGKMAGCDAYLTKPIDEEQLMTTMVRYLPEGAAMADVLGGNSPMFLDNDFKRKSSANQI